METSNEFKKENVLIYQTNLNNNPNRRLMTTQRELRRIEDIVHIKNLCTANNNRVLCIGARDDSEVQTFKNAGYYVSAIDVCIETELIMKRDVAELNPLEFGTFDIIYCSHVLEHVVDPEKTLKAIRSVARNIIFIILPIVDRKPDVEHPTVYEIMKYKPETKFKDFWQAYEDFKFLQPFIVKYNCYRNALTEEYEVAFILQLR